MYLNYANALVGAWCSGAKFAPRPRAWEQPLPPGTYAVEELQEACALLGLKCPITVHTEPTRRAVRL